MEDFDINSAVEVKEDGGFDINSASEVKEESISFYNDNTKNIVNSTFNDPVKINYTDLVQFQNKSREDFVGMIDISDNEKDRKYYSDFANNSLVSSVLDFSRGFVAYPITMYQSIKRSLGQKIATEYGRFVYGDKSKYNDNDLKEFLDNLDEATLELKETQKKFIDSLGLSKTEQDSFSYDLGSLTSNIMSTIALKSPTLITALYGLGGQQELYEENIENGMSRTKAKALSYGVSTINSAIEYIGTEKLLKALKADKIISSVFQGVIAEGLEEMSQNIVEDIAMTTIGDRQKTAGEIAKDTLYAGLLGAIGGLGGAGIGHILYNGKQELIKNNINESEAENIIQKVDDTLKNKEVQSEVVNLIKRENDNTTYNGNNYVEGAEFIKKSIAENNNTDENIIDVVDNILQNEKAITENELNNLVLNDTIKQENFDKIKEELKNNSANLKNILKQNYRDISRNFGDNYETSYKQIKIMEKVANASIPREPITLIKWLKQQGGVYDEFGELKSRNLKDLIRKSSGKNGDKFSNTPDSLLKKAVEEGFFGNVDYRKLSVEDLYNAIDDELDGNVRYRQKDYEKVLARNEKMAQSQQAQELLDTLPFNYNEFIELIDKAREHGLKVITKEKMDNYKETISGIRQEIRSLKTSVKQDIKAVQSQLIQIIRKTDLTNENKSKFLYDIKNIQTAEQLENSKNYLIEKIENLLDDQTKKFIVEKLDKELFYTKNVRQGTRMVGKYLYETNKFFKDIREYNKFTRETAKQELINLEENSNEEFKNSVEYNFREKFLRYKMQGLNDSSRSLLESIYNDVINIKKYSADEKLLNKELKKNQKIIDKKEILDAMKSNFADKNTLKTKLTSNLYINQVGNMYDIINYITNKDIAEKYNLELNESQLNQNIFNKENKINNELKKVLNIKSDWELKATIRDYQEKNQELFDPRGIEKISKIEIMDIYNSIKNEKKKNDFYTHYGKQQIDDLISTLSSNEKKFADTLMNNLDYYDKINEVFIKMFNTDLKKESNYWPATSEHENNFSVFGSNLNFDGNNQSLSITKERVVQDVIPRITNAYTKAMENVQQSEYLINMAEKYKSILDIFASPDVKFAIKNKFGDGVLKSLKQQLNNQSLSQRAEFQNTTDKVVNKLLSNWTVAKIGSSFPVFFRQMGAITNYSIDVNTMDWLSNFKKALLHPKQTIDYMRKIDFVNERLNSGYNQELKRALDNDLNFVKFEKVMGNLGRRIDNINFTEIFTSMVRYGDISSVIFGGYANIQSNIKAGMTEEQAINKFITTTLRTQQSGLKASLSPKQQSKNTLNKLLLTFRNAGIQYQRNVANSIIQYNRGEISKQQMTKTLFHYLVVQPALYVYLGKLAKELFLSWGDDDEDEEYDFSEDLKDLGSQSIATFTAGMPLVDFVADKFYKKATNQKIYSILSFPLLDDLEKGFRNILKDDVTLQDYINFGMDMSEPLTGIPSKNFNKIQKQFTSFDITKDID